MQRWWVRRVILGLASAPPVAAWVALWTLLPFAVVPGPAGTSDELGLAEAAACGVAAAGFLVGSPVVIGLLGRWGLGPLALAGPVQAGVGLLLSGFVRAQAAAADARTQALVDDWAFPLTRWLAGQVHDVGTFLVALILGIFTVVLDLLLLIPTVMVAMAVSSPPLFGVGLLWTGATAGVVLAAVGVAALARRVLAGRAPSAAEEL